MRLVFALVPSSGVLLWLLTGDPWLGVTGVLVTGVGGVWLLIRHSRRMLGRVTAARDAFDARALHRAVDDAERLGALRASVRQELTLQRALAFMMEEDFRRALEVLETVDLSSAHPRTRLAVKADAAVCRAHLGETARAVIEAEAAERQAREIFPEGASVHEGIVGLVYERAGRPAEAIARLQRALAGEVGNAGVEALLAFHLGEAHETIGQPAEATAAWTRARDLAPHTASGRRAAAKLSKGR